MDGRPPHTSPRAPRCCLARRLGRRPAAALPVPITQRHCCLGGRLLSDPPLFPPSLRALVSPHLPASPFASPPDRRAGRKRWLWPPTFPARNPTLAPPAAPHPRPRRPARAGAYGRRRGAASRASRACAPLNTAARTLRKGAERPPAGPGLDRP
ncbi:MAG: hypothetical protein J3K34DRAFT_425147 [Monoraphidium minutum]|nr:MAG: hypothetical protein J3K34DRAFT_425147 [Monoraphidium minutum]